MRQKGEREKDRGKERGKRVGVEERPSVVYNIYRMNERGKISVRASPPPGYFALVVRHTEIQSVNVQRRG